MSLVLPKPAFDSCDETSLKLKWEKINISTLRSLTLQYKEIHEDWNQAQGCNVPVDSPGGEIGTSLTQTDVVDLKPGTPYYVRLQAVDNDGNITNGPDTVFDTKPVDCGPKRRCTVS
jgi:hypothetical protein|mmetsp:Transcript_31934/g.53851  ORF Transcript_31934/g.53851 Transcript_31934/m.53851 type:complete len:117 (-) Transcript_31934:3887-4237(-)